MNGLGRKQRGGVLLSGGRADGGCDGSPTRARKTTLLSSTVLPSFIFCRIHVDIERTPRSFIHSTPPLTSNLPTASTSSTLALTSSELSSFIRSSTANLKDSVRRRERVHERGGRICK